MACAEDGALDLTASARRQAVRPPLPAPGNAGAQFAAPTAALSRLIGILAINPRQHD